jgi:hypothetical protein
MSEIARILIPDLTHYFARIEEIDARRQGAFDKRIGPGLIDAGDRLERSSPLPNVIVPRHSSETTSPVPPNRR